MCPNVIGSKVPGYIALFLHQPQMVVGTFVISIITYLIVKLLSYFMLIYGKRRLVLSLLIGFFIGYFVKENVQDGSLLVIGNIIPGLIASWMDRQGVFRTISEILPLKDVKINRENVIAQGQNAIMETFS